MRRCDSRRRMENKRISLILLVLEAIFASSETRNVAPKTSHLYHVPSICSNSWLQARHRSAFQGASKRFKILISLLSSSYTIPVLSHRGQRRVNRMHNSFHPQPTAASSSLIPTKRESPSISINHHKIHDGQNQTILPPNVQKYQSIPQLV
jgi:hypothetical protein